MKIVLKLIFAFGCFFSLKAQTTMNVYQNNGSVVILPITSIDSLSFTTNPPPSTLDIYQLNGTIQHIALSSIDSITYTIGGGNTNGILNPNLSYGNLIDQDGNSYATIIIGTQEWMAENLRVTTYSNGDSIPKIIDPTQWSGLSSGAWVHYNNSVQFEIPYGKLYNWYAIADPRNVCPSGWHVPSGSEWNLLIGTLDSAYNPNDNGTQSSIAGGKMKSVGNQYWQSSPNVNSTNDSGFSGLPGGGRSYNGQFGSIGTSAAWWSSSEDNAFNAWIRNMASYNNSISSSSVSKLNGNSVRCLRN